MISPLEIEAKFYIRRQGRKLGPFDLAQIRQMITRRQIGPKDEISPADSIEWKRIEQWDREHRSKPDFGAPSPNEIAVVVTNQKMTEPSVPLQATNVSDGWYVAVGGKSEGPFDLDTLGQRIGQHNLDAETRIWRSGMPDWKPAKEVLPAVFNPKQSLPVNDLRTGSSALEALLVQEQLRRRAFWVLCMCVMTYIFSLEMLVAAVLQVYSGVIVRRFGGGGNFALSALAFLIMGCLLLMTAIEMTKLRSAFSRAIDGTDSSLLNRQEYRVWLCAGLSASFIILCQIAFSIFVLIELWATT